ncbi:hypothetical protein D3C74_225250 [compost metagenome]
MEEKVREVINSWNPIEIYPLLEDEYNTETEKIMLAIRNTNSTQELAGEIINVFTEAFGKEFTRSIEDCGVIAEEIIK